MRKRVLSTLILLWLVSISQAQTNTYKVYAIRFAASSYPFTVADWTDGGPKSEKVNINFMVWLIKGSNGKNILVDAGFLNDIEDAKDFKIVNYIRPDSALMKLGVRPADITDVVLSHPHWDHMDGTGLFPSAQVWIQKEDYNYFAGTTWQKGVGSGGFAKRDVRELVDLNLAGRVTLVDGDNQEILPGIRVYTGSRHTFNSQYVQVQSGSKKIILASDNIWVYYSLEHLVPPAAGGTLDPAGYVNAMKRMKTLATSDKYIIPGHDAKVFSLFPGVADGIVEIK